MPAPPRPREPGEQNFLKALEVQGGKRVLGAGLARASDGLRSPRSRNGSVPVGALQLPAANLANAIYFLALSGTLLVSPLMLAHFTTIRDVSRALPALISDPDLDVPVSTELLDAHTRGLRQRYDSFLPVIDRAGKTLAAAIQKFGPEERADPEGEGARALEQAEAYFKDRRKDLLHLRNPFVEAGASPAHDVFDALERLDNLYGWIVATMQEVRWSVLISDGVKDKAESPERRSFATSREWLASLREE